MDRRASRVEAKADETVTVEGAAASAAPLDPEFVARCKAALADPRPNIPAAEVRAHLGALHEERLKRGA
jgi:hypothetical protein